MAEWCQGCDDFREVDIPLSDLLVEVKGLVEAEVVQVKESLPEARRLEVKEEEDTRQETAEGDKKS